MSFLFLADFPAPVHGFSSINKKMYEECLKYSDSIFCINTTPSFVAKLYGTRLWLPIKIVHSLYCLIRLLIICKFIKSRLCYRPINGGSGQVFDLLYCLILKIFGFKIIFHHHSFQYLNKYSVLFNFLCQIAGKSTIHIALGDEMQEKLISVYKIHKIRVISNLAFFSELDTSDFQSEQAKEIDDGILVIGHLSNLCIEKGTREVCSVLKWLENEGGNYRGVIAGPFVDLESRKMVNELSDRKTLRYEGPLFGDDKLKFFSNVDVFLFPSNYKNEAEPLVLYEAAQFGAYLIGTEQGCMKSVIKLLNGCSMKYSDKWSNKCGEILITNNEKIVIERDKRIRDFKYHLGKSKKALVTFFQEDLGLCLD